MILPLPLSFLWHLYRKNFLFAAALAQRTKRPLPYLTYLYHHLGMYQTALDNPPKKYQFRNQIAYIASLAACGNDIPITKALELSTHLGSSKLKYRLAEEIMPYAPTLALQIIQKLPVSPIHFALHQNLNNMKNKYPNIHPGNKIEDANLLLLKANQHSKNALDHLSLINQMFTLFQLESVQPLIANTVLNTQNVLCINNTTVDQGPLISIIMTAYQCEDRIKNAIQSLQRQTYKNIEIIVVNDNSPDNCEKIIKGIAESDARIHYIKLHYNIGTFAAKNIGIRFAKGEFVTCQDSDDWAHPRKIELQALPLIHQKNLIFTTSRWVRMQDNGIFYARQLYPLIRLNPASPMFRKKLVLQTMGGWDWVKTGADSEFLERLKLVFGENSGLHLKQPLTLGAHRENSLMTAASTGYRNGISPVRLAYWESWRKWHINCLAENKTPKIASSPFFKRPFDAPESIHIPEINLRNCWSSLKD